MVMHSQHFGQQFLIVPIEPNRDAIVFAESFDDREALNAQIWLPEQRLETRGAELAPDHLDVFVGLKVVV